MPKYVSNHKAILQDDGWTGAVKQAARILTYSFPKKPLKDIMGDTGWSTSQVKTFQKLQSQHEKLVRSALNEWAKVSGISFIEVKGSDGDLRFSGLDFDAVGKGHFTGFAYYPNETNSFDFLNPNSITNGPEGFNAISGDVFLNTRRKSGWDKELVMHEIGHALGFKHPFEGNPRLKKTLDNNKHTVMSYNRVGVSEVGDLDIAAARKLYGKKDLKFSYKKAKVQVDIEGTGKSETIFGTSIKDKIKAGGGNDKIFALEHNDKVNAGGGKDGVNGGQGNDVLNGDGGNDVLAGASGKDKLNGGSGNDKLHGGDQNDTLKGGTGNDMLFGDADDDRLFGDAGADTIDGGYGDDSLNGGDDADKFVFRFTFGNDRIEDFEDGVDIIDLSDFGFSSKAGALWYFTELGTTSDNTAQFSFGTGNTVTIKGVDLADITEDDILI